MKGGVTKETSFYAVDLGSLSHKYNCFRFTDYLPRIKHLLHILHLQCEKYILTNNTEYIFYPVL
jgi:hypothetical protein